MNIYIGNMSPNTSEKEITALFTKFGEVNSVRIIMGKENHKSKGFGFVDMECKDEGLRAIASLDNKKYKNLNLEVSEATSGYRDSRELY
ncbi:RNA-binding protein [Rurimicrobium arvi]|uniref:RNA-binding protein n=1 Tax=Rurimicrobium arvi TaxID=2049916 RepID=A0ABP8MXY0_9BACT